MNEVVTKEMLKEGRKYYDVYLIADNSLVITIPIWPIDSRYHGKVYSEQTIVNKLIELDMNPLLFKWEVSEIQDYNL